MPKHFISNKAPWLTVLYVFIFSNELLANNPLQKKKYHLVLSEDFDSTYSTIINDSIWARTPPWNQGTNQTININCCFHPGPDCETEKDSTWDVGYMIRDKKDTTTLSVSGGTCRLKANKTAYMGEVWNWDSCHRVNCKTPCDTITTTCFRKDSALFKYTRGTLFSRDAFKYGYFEIRFRLPPEPGGNFTYQGIGPNFWLFKPYTSEANLWSEIDIFEIDAFNPGKNHSNFYTTNVHFQKTKSDPKLSRTFNYRDISAGEWHTAAVWWSSRFIKFYLNGKLIHHFPARKLSLNPSHLAAMSIIVDLNVPAANFCNNINSEKTLFPYTYEIDYVRVYQKKK